jgi:RNA polymerase sigma factor (sigma-70 family)
MVRPVARAADVEELYRRHAEELRGYLHRRAGPVGADLLADVFVVALRRLDDLPEPALQRAWLFTTARRLLLAEARSSRKRHDAERERARFGEPAADDAELDRSDLTHAVREALASLREPDRELIRLTEWERLDITEAAAVLGLRPGTARVRLHRARRALAAHSSLRGLLGPIASPAVDAVEAPQTHG